MLTTDAAQNGAAPAQAGRKEWIGLAVLSLACLLYVMDLTVLHLAVPEMSEPKAYFKKFFDQGLGALARLKPAEIARIRGRRALQMRAYFALQVRFLLKADAVAALRN